MVLALSITYNIIILSVLTFNYFWYLYIEQCTCGVQGAGTLVSVGGRGLEIEEEE